MRHLKWELFYWWILANTVRAVAGASVWLVGTSSGDFDARTLGITSLLSLVIAGVMTVLLQWLVLRRYLERAGWWAFATFAGLLVASLVWVLATAITADAMVEAIDSGNVEALQLLNALGSAFNGAVLGVFQWLVLRRQVPRAGWWVLASIAGYVVGALVSVRAIAWIGFVVWAASWFDVNPFAHMAVMGVMSVAIYGAITGVALMLLLSRRAKGSDDVNANYPAKVWTDD